MSGQNDNMNACLLTTGIFKYKDFLVKLVNNQRTYEVYKEDGLVLKVPANWSTYFQVSELIGLSWLKENI